MTDTDEHSTAQLLTRLSEQTSSLIREELRLAQLELQQKGKRAGLAGGLFGGAGLVALYGVGALVAALIIALGTAMDDWLAALIVGVVLLAAGGLMALLGRKELAEATPPVPEAALQSTRDDVTAVKEAARR